MKNMEATFTNWLKKRSKLNIENIETCISDLQIRFIVNGVRWDFNYNDKINDYELILKKEYIRLSDIFTKEVMIQLLNNYTVNIYKEDINFLDLKERIIEATNNNDNIYLREIYAKLVGNKKFIKIVNNINAICLLEGENPISDYSYIITKELHELGRVKYGNDTWNENIYNPK